VALWLPLGSKGLSQLKRLWICDCNRKTCYVHQQSITAHTSLQLYVDRNCQIGTHAQAPGPGTCAVSQCPMATPIKPRVYDIVTSIAMLFCFAEQNFTEMRQLAAQLRPKNDFWNGSRPPSWIFFSRISTLTRDINIANLSVRPLRSGFLWKKLKIFIHSFNTLLL